VVKAAIEGLTLSLRREVTLFGITAMTVEAGGFRTDLAGRSLVQPETSRPLASAARSTVPVTACSPDTRRGQRPR
jgi:NAD(P)-dependent dehydrogenase (short-subunit alcohol dehydrogenase family)